jgi:hypothetical protein
VRRELIGDLLTICLSAFILAHLCLILVYGEVRILEENRSLLIGEIVLVGGCLLLGIDRLWYDMK